MILTIPNGRGVFSVDPAAIAFVIPDRAANEATCTRSQVVDIDGAVRSVAGDPATVVTALGEDFSTFDAIPGYPLAPERAATGGANAPLVIYVADSASTHRHDRIDDRETLVRRLGRAQVRVFAEAA